MGPSPPFFEFNQEDESDVLLFDTPSYIHQEPPEFEEFGPDRVFDSTGRLAELRVDDYVVVVTGWSEPKIVSLTITCAGRRGTTFQMKSSAVLARSSCAIASRQ
jgi:hypothetical protein